MLRLHTQMPSCDLFLFAANIQEVAGNLELVTHSSDTIVDRGYSITEQRITYKGEQYTANKQRTCISITPNVMTSYT